ncbi:aspartate aminotransferase family protein [Sediminispirochaeta smaragdinae]|uniref:Acetylornithine aminotransferase n=1 Tax=Sediminispirochaeta smaragdinae (strain DSM 11293 / JCM 15392 / SEBR 4228) TaxID=573413 RepID=E1R724_SEDSS|nr:aspartate aminotransferase family protein [Sediminispirochaeta smaragdinae]ADK81351.1 acetylornithine and succinylornithine aminotransferase [Sediminispirochaeta smaragdinae DSM 11293]
MVSKTYLQKNSENALETYASFPIVLDHGKGCTVTDVDGKEYLDFVAGVAVNILGHGNIRLAKAIGQQAERLMHCSNLYLNPVTVDYMDTLLAYSGFDKAFFCNSGTESIEAALKLARKWAGVTGKAGRDIIALNGSFHGRSFGALSVTGQKKYQAPFAPLLPGVRFAEANDPKALEEAVDDSVCAIIMEPIQGEGGIKLLSKAFVEKADELRKKYDLLLIFDEVQCGFGRSGKLFAWEHFGIRPDILCMAKAIAGGFPMGGILVDKRAAAFKPGDHAATFGGNPLACAAASVVLDELTNKGLLTHAEEVGAYLGEKLEELKGKHPHIVDARGLGLMRGIELSSGSADVISACIDKGLLLVRAGSEVIRFVPPLIVTKEEIDKAISILDEVLSQ